MPVSSGAAAADQAGVNSKTNSFANFPARGVAPETKKAKDSDEKKTKKPKGGRVVVNPKARRRLRIRKKKPSTSQRSRNFAKVTPSSVDDNGGFVPTPPPVASGSGRRNKVRPSLSSSSAAARKNRLKTVGEEVRSSGGRATNTATIASLFCYSCSC